MKTSCLYVGKMLKVVIAKELEEAFSLTNFLKKKLLNELISIFFVTANCMWVSSFRLSIIMQVNARGGL